MPSKKKKFNARFPPARIKKIMQTDEDVGKVAAAVPVIISRALELFIQSLIVKASETTRAKHAKTLSSSHIKQTIQSEKQFDFLKDLVASIPDVAPADEDNSDVHVPPSSSSVPAIVPERVVSATTPRPRGRPRKKPAEGDEVPKIPKKRGRKPKAAVAAALAAQPTMTASSEHDSSDSSDDEAEPANHSEMPTLPSSQHTHAAASTPPRLTPEPSCHNLQPPPHVSLSTGQSLPSSPAPPVMPPPPASSSAISPSHVPFPTTSSTSRTPTSMPHETNIPVPSSISHSTSSSSTAPPPVQLTSMPASSLALPPPIRGAIPTPSAMPHTLPPYAQMPRTSEMPMNLSAPTSHIPHPAFYHPSSYQASTSGVLDLSKSAQPPSDSAAAASAQPPMFAMPPGGGRFPHYPMLPGYSQHMGLPPMLTRPPLISSMMASSSKPSGTPGEMPPAFPQPPFAGFPPRPRPSASEDYDS